MHNTTELETVTLACHQLKLWHKEGKSLPGYQVNYGKVFMSRLINFDLKADVGNDYDWFIHKLVPISQKISGPYGWAIVQTLLAQRKSDNRKQRKQQRKLQREIRRERRR